LLLVQQVLQIATQNREMVLHEDVREFEVIARDVSAGLVGHQHGCCVDQLAEIGFNFHFFLSTRGVTSRVHKCRRKPAREVSSRVEGAGSTSVPLRDIHTI